MANQQGRVSFIKIVLFIIIILNKRHVSEMKVKLEVERK